MPRKPRRQGSFDGACGFYAVANALSVVSPRQVSRDDFTVLLEALAPRTGLPRQFFDGTGRRELNTMLGALLADPKFSDVVVHRPYWSKGAAGLGEYWRCLQSHFETADGAAAAIIKFAHEPSPTSWYCHWTVVRGVTAASLLLFDSEGAARISRRRSRLWDDRAYHSTRPYALDHTATFLLSSDS